MKTLATSSTLANTPSTNGVQAASVPTSAAEGIDRRTGLSRAEFIRLYRNPKRPVILTDATRDWPARSKFTFEFFKSQMGEREVLIRNKTYKLGAFIDQLLASTAENPAPYPCKLNLRDGFSDLAPDVSPRYDLANPDRVGSRLVGQRFLDGLSDFEIFLGGPGGEFPYLHYDYLGLFAYINMMQGEKEFTVYSPDQAQYLYVNPVTGWTSLVENHHRPDLERYPLLAKTRPVKAVLRAGETLFIPSGWWHTAKSLTPSISVAFDQLCASNWGFFRRDCCRQRAGRPFKRAMAWAALTGAGWILSTQEWMRGVR
jgi:histone arginine demethylase JMJD6